jgi:ABC-type branched-subunit amino acid transport system permease subunit
MAGRGGLRNSDRAALVWAPIAIAIGLIIPSYTGFDVHLDLSIIFVYAILALSMAFMWGYVGMLSFGQTAFFGLGGYSYAVWSLNFGETTIGMLLAILIPALAALVLGYFMIYGRISKIYFTVMTMVVTIVLEKAVRATSDERFVIGDVKLRGQNGIAGLPDLQVPWDPSTTLFVTEVYYLTFIAMALVYTAFHLILRFRFGRVLVGIRENERRMALLGYDGRRYKLAISSFAAASPGSPAGSTRSGATSLRRR